LFVSNDVVFRLALNTSTGITETGFGGGGAVRGLYALGVSNEICYPENIVSVCNGNRNYFHGYTCQRWGVCVRLFLYQYKVKRFYPYRNLVPGNGDGYSFPCMVRV
jgi:hypothetical protein